MAIVNVIIRKLRMIFSTTEFSFVDCTSYTKGFVKYPNNRIPININSPIMIWASNLKIKDIDVISVDIINKLNRVRYNFLLTCFFDVLGVSMKSIFLEEG